MLVVINSQRLDVNSEHLYGKIQAIHCYLTIRSLLYIGNKKPKYLTLAEDIFIEVVNPLKSEHSFLL